MSRRIERLTGDPTVWVGTFHRFCARLLRKYAPLVGLQENYTIYDTDDSHQALRQALRRLKIDANGSRPRRSPRPLAGQEQPDRPRPVQTAPGHALAGGRSRLPGIPKQLTQSNAADFDDLLFHVATLLRDNPKSAPASTNATASSSSMSIRTPIWPNTPSPGRYRRSSQSGGDGDPDQSIYGWRGRI